MFKVNNKDTRTTPNGLVLLKKNFMAPFYGWGSTASRLEPLRGGSLLFTTKFPEVPGTHFIDLVSRPWSHPAVGAFIVNFEHISHFALVFLLLTLNM